MDIIALLMALKALNLPDEQVAAAIAAYIEEHPEAIAEVSVASLADTKAYLGID